VGQTWPVKTSSPTIKFVIIRLAFRKVTVAQMVNKFPHFMETKFGEVIAFKRSTIRLNNRNVWAFMSAPAWRCSACVTPHPLIWRQYVLSKRREILTQRHNVTSQKTWIFKNAAVSYSTPTQYECYFDCWFRIYNLYPRYIKLTTDSSPHTHLRSTSVTDQLRPSDISRLAVQLFRGIPLCSQMSCVPSLVSNINRIALR
jgi:hypothetical protein